MMHAQPPDVHTPYLRTCPHLFFDTQTLAITVEQKRKKVFLNFTFASLFAMCFWPAFEEEKILRFCALTTSSKSHS